MSEKFKNSKFYKAMKNPKVSRAVYIAMVLILVAIAVVVGITAAANRTKKPVKDPQVTTTAPSTDEPTPGTVAPEETDAPSTETKAPATTQTPSGTVSKPLPSFSLPVAGKINKYHDASTQVFSNTMNDYRVHLGVDITTAEAAPVYAAAAGTVQKVWSDPMMGYCIAIKHDGDAITVYKNLAKDLPAGIAEGAKVKAGQQIANVGESAMLEIAEEPHLHLEMTVGGIQVDPVKYFSAKDVAALGVDESYAG